MGVASLLKFIVLHDIGPLVVGVCTLSYMKNELSGALCYSSTGIRVL